MPARWLGLLDRSQELRLQDYSLTDEQLDIVETFRRFFRSRCPRDAVRNAEPLGFDPELWSSTTELGVLATRMSQGDDDPELSIVDLVLIAEEMGSVLAPIPLAETAATAPLIGLHAELASRTQDFATGSYIATVALSPVAGEEPQLVPAGAIADAVVALRGDTLVLCELEQRLPLARNLGNLPLAWWAPDTRAEKVIASGIEACALHRTAVAEWRLLTSAALVGIGRAAVGIAADFVKTRLTSGTPLGALQAVSHPLADAETRLIASRRLAWRAAWLLQHEPDRAGNLAAAAFVHADEAAANATATALHMHGGFGFSTESDVSLYFRRAKGWSVVGDPRQALSEIANNLSEGELVSSGL